MLKQISDKHWFESLLHYGATRHFLYIQIYLMCQWRTLTESM